ncbi:TetR/AcrR family transcriptional regulator [Maritalea porphyrae]|uniref:TetR/AcrR family transcriptional regulator n=1 Tax=Maritalea porphyrae TaxID=880732 RepID=UPI0022B02235|nr:TetR/AcrR family transcriptional regulator [Maritalea porphyrae]MCZ4271377.1 TetR/AcrR family transcriptional regulator [Maritalea porphyrae]
MGRPSAFDREQAVDDVMHMIWRDGYEASSVKALSEKLGITRSSFYNAFGTREALFKEVLEQYCKQSPDFALALATPPIDVKMLLTLVFREACAARAADPEGRGCLAINSVAELCNQDEELGPVLESLVLGSINQIQTVLNWGVASKEFPRDLDTHALALCLQNLLIGLNVMCKVVKDEAELLLTAETTLKALGMYEYGLDEVDED